MTTPDDNLDISCDIDASWRVNSYCNYECAYCFSRSKDKKELWKGDGDIQRKIAAFDQTGLKWFILLTGGEPFFSPNFVQLCQGLSQNHMIALNTNLSHKAVYTFADTINPRRVKWIHCSIHIEETERLKTADELIRKFRYLADQGFPVFASYVLYPPFLGRYERDYEYFKARGIVIWPKIFRGPYTPIRSPYRKGLFRKINRAAEILFARQYPQAFREPEQKKILAYMDQSRRDAEVLKCSVPVMLEEHLPHVWHDRKVLGGLPSFTGQPCRAGRDFVVISERGDVSRCHGEAGTRLGNIFAGEFHRATADQPCRANTCICPFEGFHYLVPKDQAVISDAVHQKGRAL